MGTLQGASCAAGSDQKPPAAQGGRPAKGGQAGGGEFPLLKAWFSQLAPPLRPSALAYFRWISLPSVSSLRSQPFNAPCWVTHVIGTE